MPDRRPKHKCYCCNYTFFCKRGKHYPVYDRCLCNVHLIKCKKLYSCSNECADRVDETVINNRDHGLTILEYMRT